MQKLGISVPVQVYILCRSSCAGISREGFGEWAAEAENAERDLFFCHRRILLLAFAWGFDGVQLIGVDVDVNAVQIYALYGDGSILDWKLGSG